MANASFISSYCLEYSSFACIEPTSSISKIGGLGRGTNNGWNSETLLIYNLDSFIGKTVTSVTLTGTISNYDNVRTGTAPIAMVSAQNRKRSAYWVTPPRYDDINAVVNEWDTALSSSSVPNASSGTVVFNSTPAFVAEIQKLIDGDFEFWAPGVDRTWRDGIIVRMPTVNSGFYSKFSGWTLDINTTTTAINNDHYYRMGR